MPEQVRWRFVMVVFSFSVMRSFAASRDARAIFGPDVACESCDLNLREERRVCESRERRCRSASTVMDC